MDHLRPTAVIICGCLLWSQSVLANPVFQLAVMKNPPILPTDTFKDQALVSAGIDYVHSLAPTEKAALPQLIRDFEWHADGMAEELRALDMVLRERPQPIL